MKSNPQNSAKSSPTSTQSSNPSEQQQEPQDNSSNNGRNIFWRSPYNFDLKANSDENVRDNNDPSLTIQSHAEDADLNVLMRRFGITGKMPDNVNIPQYGDFTGVSDYRSALEALNKANEDFMQIPADIRAKFDNDPQALLEFASTPGNAAAMVELGLAKWRDPPQGTPPVTGTPTPTGGPGGSNGQTATGQAQPGTAETAK